MFQANKYFFLAGCADHINATFTKLNANVLIQFSHSRDRRLNDVLSVEVIKAGDAGYQISYDIQHNNQISHQGKSEIIPQTEIYGVIAALANETIPE